jgi:hypothetical protein
VLLVVVVMVVAAAALLLAAGVVLEGRGGDAWRGNLHPPAFGGALVLGLGGLGFLLCAHGVCVRGRVCECGCGVCER